MSLALPFARATASPQPYGSRSGSGAGASPKRQGKRKMLDRLQLDEEDDVDESDLVAIPANRRRIDEEEDDEDEVEGEGDEDEGRRRRDRESPVRQSGAGAAARKAGRAEEIDRKGKKRRAETFLLREQLDPDQAKRFDTFSTVAINKNAIKRLNREMYDQHCPPQISMVLAGMAKIFVADVVELAKDLQPHSAHPTGPLQPYHLKLARLRLEQQGLVADGGSTRGVRPKKALFRRR